MYNEWFKNQIEKRCIQIKDHSERIKFLYDETSMTFFDTNDHN
jgi:hypothetical protein